MKGKEKNHAEKNHHSCPEYRVIFVLFNAGRVRGLGSGVYR
jgi:hypothetical protein